MRWVGSTSMGRKTMGNPQSEKKSRILALSRDVGSLQAIIPVLQVLQTNPSYELHVFAPDKGAAALREAGVAFAPLGQVTEAFEQAQPHLVLAGSSPAWERGTLTPEQIAIILARQKGAKSLTVLDYWGVYRERFCSQDDMPSLFPDRLCVMDKRCFDDLVELGAEPETLAITHNPWMDRVAKLAAANKPYEGAEKGRAWTVLYVSQPLNAYPEEKEPQIKMLQALVEALPVPEAGEKHKVLVWKHPAEPDERWAQASLFSAPHVEVSLCRRRGAEILASVDFLATYYSTVAYEGLYYGTPCLLLRFGVQTDSPPPQYAEELGLCQGFDSKEEMKHFFSTVDPRALRGQVQAGKAQMLAKGLFFNDGRATDRVVAEIEKMLEGKAL